MTAPQGNAGQSFAPSASAPSYPAPPAGTAPSAGPKLSVSWTGFLIAIGAIVAGIGAFLPWEKLVVFVGGRVLATLTVNGTGSVSTTGDPSIKDGITVGSGGKVALGLAVLLLAAAILILARKGRLWVSIVSVVLAALAVVVGLSNLGSAKSDGKTLDAAVKVQNDAAAVHALTKMGIDLLLVGGAVALVGAILALCLRRRQAA